ncbi:MAG: hypothetical protein D3914_16430 [Candidatus Electrothrix sp. LOE2]|nr:hypothetical protein [Candidatus Electrothrix sp. LOE2]
MKLFIGSLPYNITENELTELFGEYGSVVSADLVKDHFTGRSKGFSFVDSLKNKIAENVIGPCDLPACP